FCPRGEGEYDPASCSAVVDALGEDVVVRRFPDEKESLSDYVSAGRVVSLWTLVSFHYVKPQGLLLQHLVGLPEGGEHSCYVRTCRRHDRLGVVH
ncbi:hypothetical protein A2U01_0076521, partial [Trifolium medium]|nr:hypothetical protein [Trifolium medium]